MIRRLTLSKFRCFREFDIELAPVTVFMGANGSGKSSILQALSLIHVATMLAARDAVMAAGATGAQVYRIERSVTDGAWPFGFDDDDLLHQSGKANAFEIVATFDGERGVRRSRLVRNTRGGELEIELAGRAVEPERQKASTMPAAALSAVLHSQINRKAKCERFVDDTVMNRLLTEGRHSEVVRNCLARLSSQSKARLNRALREAQGVELVRCTSLDDVPLESPLEAIFRHDGNEFELARANEGLLNAVTFLVQIERRHENPLADGLLVLDEPEAHLHPRARTVITNRLIELAGRERVQVVSATHSLEVAGLLGRHAPGMLYVLAPLFSRPRRIETEEELVRALDPTHDFAPFASINFVKHRRILFHEGPTDYPILLFCARALFRTRPGQLKRFEEWTHVPLGGAANAPTAKLLGKLVSTKLIRKLDEESRLFMVTVLDRDYEREPGVVLDESGQIFHRKKTWSRHSIESLFLDAELLAAYLQVIIDNGIAIVDLERIIPEAVAATNRDPTLCVPAEDKLAEVYFRLQRQKFPEALKAARAEVKTHPEVWQRGKDRAGFILGRIRTALPVGIQRRVRSSIDGILEAIPLDRFSPDMVPDEIRDLLEMLAS